MRQFLLNPSFTIFGIEIAYYAVCIVCGMIAAIISGYFLLKKVGYKSDDMFDYTLVAIPFGVLGARLYFFLFPYEGSVSNWADFWKFRQGGLGIYGGIILGGLAVLVLCLIKKQNFVKVLDALLPGVMLAQAIGRWGNFINQEAYGNPITNPSWQWFPFGVEIGGEWFQATFFYESLWNVIGFLLIIFLLRKHYKKGTFASFYALYYGAGRMWIESLRTDSLYIIIGGWDTGIKVSQAVSFVMIMAGLIGFAIIYKEQLKAFFCKLFKIKSKEVEVVCIDSAKDVNTTVEQLNDKPVELNDKSVEVDDKASQQDNNDTK